MSIADIRTDYKQASLSEAETGVDPVGFFRKWFAEAQHAQVAEVNAMTLATVDESHHPHARIVLLKGVEHGGFCFYTNYQSAKGQQIDHNPHAALVFFWAELERQVRIEGCLEKLSAEESDLYFHSRPRQSQIGAWASPQSRVIPDRAVLTDNEHRYTERFGEGGIDRPGHWGGYVLKPSRIEFWQGRPSRLHDRICFEADADGSWHKFRLAP